MRYILGICLLVLSSCGNTFYIVRHAEKEPVPAGASQMQASDPPLSSQGNERAQDLKETLKGKNIIAIYSTNYKRTVNTGLPLAVSKGLTVQVYNSKKDSMDALISKLRTITKGDVVVVGHSNTIDDIANKLCGSTVVPGDLDESIYDNLFVVKRKGTKFVFKNEKYGKASE